MKNIIDQPDLHFRPDKKPDALFQPFFRFADSKLALSCAIADYSCLPRLDTDFRERRSSINHGGITFKLSEFKMTRNCSPTADIQVSLGRGISEYRIAPTLHNNNGASVFRSIVGM